MTDPSPTANESADLENKQNKNADNTEVWRVIIINPF